MDVPIEDKPSEVVNEETKTKKKRKKKHKKKVEKKVEKEVVKHDIPIELLKYMNKEVKTETVNSAEIHPASIEESGGGSGRFVSMLQKLAILIFFILIVIFVTKK